MERVRNTRLLRLVSGGKNKKGKLNLKHVVGENNGNISLLSMTDTSSIGSDLSTCPVHCTPAECFLEAASKGKQQEFQRLYVENPERLHIQDSNGNTALHHASINGHLHIVDFIIQHDGDINAINSSGDTPLHEAVRHEQTIIIDFLLKNEADSSILNDLQMAPIHLAIDCDSLKSLEALLKHKSVNVKLAGESGFTPLHYCAYRDRAEGAKLLLKHGAKPCMKCNHGYYPIHIAARAAAATTLDVIIKYVEALGYTRAEVLSFEDKENNTALHSSVNSGYPEAVRVCLNAGAPVDAQQEDKSTPLHFACAQGGLEMIKIMYEIQESKFLSAMNTTDILKMTPLHRAALFNHVGVVEYLLDKGADINALDANDRTPLFVAASKGAWSTVNLLIKRGANIALKDEKNRNFLHVIIKGGGSLNMFEDDVFKNVKNLLNETDDIGCTPLHYATREGQLNAIDTLISMGALLNPKNKMKQSPLHFAARYGRYNTCKRLLNSKDGPGIINEVDEDGSTALHHAAKNGHVKIITLLMQRGAYVTRDHEGNTPLHMAVIHGHTRSMRCILNVHGNLLDSQNNDGNTALHVACQVGQVPAVTLLMSADAKFSLNGNGGTFFDLAIDNKHTDVATAIVKHNRWIEVLHTSSDAGCGMSRLIEHLPDVGMVVLDNCQKDSKTDEKTGGCKVRNSYIDYDFQFLQCPYTYTKAKQNPGEEVLPMYALNLMVKFGRVELLSHPVCKAYLSMKWLAYGVWLYSINFIMYIIFLVMLTYMVSLPCVNNYSPNSTNTTNYTLRKDDNSSICHQTGMGLELSKWVVLLFTVLNILKEIFQMVQQRVKYFTDLNNLLEWVLYVSSALFVTPVLFGYSDHLNTEAGAIAIFLAWFNCLLFLQRFDVFGIYVIMFLEILRTLLQALCVFSLLFVAFGLSFFLLLRHEISEAYSTPGLSILRSAMMMLELDYMVSFNEPYTDSDDRTLPYKAPTMILLIVFVLIMPILLMNLLIGLAVGDIEAVQKDATLKRLAMQVELHTDFERRLPQKLLERVDKVNIRVYPSCRTSMISSLWSKMTWQNAYDDPSRLPKENAELAMELTKQKAKIKQLTSFVEKNHDLLRLIVQKMEIKTEEDDMDEGEVMTKDELQCKAACKNNKWKSAKLQKNVKQSMVVSKWKQISTEKRDNNTDC
ncbi:transient receptor potential cation channel subfamily A member 1 [Mytilus galloprovincialis]|uniref:Transient receptor potential cation channel subfamily A member 1 n=1 Tax=Mytilus galloprovincialis TaxID=29158 RepID=A0A8B6BK50_MYTGA|nr:transient receptor potential cation channel subfamily A member 1 [Mytilus galloprovincialis]